MLLIRVSLLSLMVHMLCTFWALVGVCPVTVIRPSLLVYYGTRITCGAMTEPRHI